MKTKMLCCCLAMMVLYSCGKGTCSCNREEATSANADTLGVDADADDTEQEEDNAWDYELTQTGINEACYHRMKAYEADVANIYYNIIFDFLPEQEAIFKKEKRLWEKYNDVVCEIAKYADYGSSTPMFVNDLSNQSIALREVTLQKMLDYLQGKKISYSKTKFTPTMIAEAYGAFRDAINAADYPGQEGKDGEIRALRTEEQRWNAWMDYRLSVVDSLPKKIRGVYKECTNAVMRAKLLQLKNQNMGCGMTSGFIEEVMLPNDCSDMELIEYPGFDKQQAKFL